MLAEKHRECTSNDCQYASKTICPTDDDRQGPEKRDKFVRVNRGNKDG